MANTARDILRTTFGYDCFRGDQEEIVRHVVAGGDALVLMPTGGGKSLCYQIPALVRDGIGVVISPLIALMQNQVDALKELGVSAAFLNSTLTPRAAAQIEDDVRNGRLKLLYIAPERLTMQRTKDLLKAARVALFAVDEAHCISQWGHDFRKDYLHLSMLHEEFPEIPRIALTATADARTRAEIIQRLELEGCRSFVSSFNRPNIQYRVTTKAKPKEQLLAFLDAEHPDDAGIVYCMTRNSVDQTAKWLKDRGRDAIPYHAGLSTDLRAKNLGRFLKDDGVIVVATIAFGMGIDKPDVRFVAHLDLPKNLEAYYQETGRAGRDGAPSTAWMAYGIQDVIMTRQILQNSDGDESHKRVERQKLQAILAYCEGTGCRRQALLQYFGETFPDPCGNCDTCLTPVATWDATIAAQKALSCVFRTGQRFGVNHVISVLLGQSNERIQNLGHDKLSTYAIGGDLEEPVWRSVFRQLIAQGRLSVDDYGAMQLAESAWPLLKSTEKLHLRTDLQQPKERASGRRRSKKRAARGKPDGTANKGLMGALSAYRKTVAKESDLPPYMIFHNKTLEQMAQIQPRTLGELHGISGVGQAKLDKYGAGFLRAIEEWQRTNAG